MAPPIDRCDVCDPDRFRPGRRGHSLLCLGTPACPRLTTGFCIWSDLCREGNGVSCVGSIDDRRGGRPAQALGGAWETALLSLPPQAGGVEALLSPAGRRGRCAVENPLRPPDSERESVAEKVARRILEARCASGSLKAGRSRLPPDARRLRRHVPRFSRPQRSARRSVASPSSAWCGPGTAAAPYITSLDARGTAGSRCISLHHPRTTWTRYRRRSIRPRIEVKRVIARHAPSGSPPPISISCTAMPAPASGGWWRIPSVFACQIRNSTTPIWRAAGNPFLERVARSPQRAEAWNTGGRPRQSSAVLRQSVSDHEAIARRLPPATRTVPPGR